MDRVHLVLVPGFAGFDALGQLEYYAGVTSLFRAWRETLDRDPLPVLHYFDNFPTAGVHTRASRLRRYLAKRIARGEFAARDAVVLIGHSTAGLDIRRLICDLAADAGPHTPVDGSRDSSIKIVNRHILQLLKRVVFLSVPHWGTNLADWLRARAVERWLVVNNLRAVLAGSQLPILDAVEGLISGWTASATDADILLALHDVLAEVDPSKGTPGPLRTADAQETASQVELWLRHMASDFDAIDDLACRPPRDKDPTEKSPAHFTPEERARELATWSEMARHLRSRSYVTIGRPPTRPEEPDRFRLTDLTYRVSYDACARGPFKPPALSGLVPAYLDPAHKALIDSWTNGAVEAWDSDGFVNTASMVWRDAEDMVLVPADHMDIVGHYTREFAEPGYGRVYQAYDLLVSDCGFDQETFRLVWNDVFTWAAEV